MSEKVLNNEEFLILLLREIQSNQTSITLASALINNFLVDSIMIEREIKNLERIDISFPLNRKNDDFSTFLKNKPSDINNCKIWNNLYTAIKHINTKRKYSFIEEIWLEFDAENFINLKNSSPGVYFNILNFDLYKVNLILELLPLLRNDSLTVGIKNKIFELLLLPQIENEYIGIGVFSGRKNQPIRIACLALISNVIQLSERFKFNESILNYLKEKPKDISDRVNIHFNVTDKDLTIQGIELFSNQTKNWDLVLESLIESRLCDAELRPQLLCWKDSFFKNVNQMETDRFNKKNSIYSNFLYCGINHFKIINNVSTNLKVYHGINFIS